MQQNIALNNSIVCFIDFLGMRNAIECNSAKTLVTIKEIYTNALTRCNNDIKDLFRYPIKAKIFSDNIILACEIIDNDDKSAHTLQCLCKIIHLAKYIQICAIQKNFLIRGAITIGDFYLDDTMVWGNALGDTYYLENNIAIFPRIILSKHIMDTWQKYAGLDFPNQITNLAIYSDEDGIHFINYLKSYGRGYEGIMQTIKTSYMVFSNRYKSEKDVKVKQKYAWHLSYLNRCLLECEM